MGKEKPYDLMATMKAIRAAERKARLEAPQPLAHRFADRKKKNNKREARGRTYREY
jgi:hypothetical protein